MGNQRLKKLKGNPLVGHASMSMRLTQGFGVITLLKRRANDAREGKGKDGTAY
jgi:hypothetical protein